MPVLLLLLTLAADTALAAWGPFGGGALLDVKDPGIGRFTGWEAGLTMSDSGNKGFWQFAGGRGSSHVDHTQLTWAQARLNFSVGAKRAAMVYAGGGAGLDWLDRNTSIQRVLSFSTQAGILVAPDRLWDLFRRAPDPGAIALNTTAAPSTTGILAAHVLLGIEAGYHTAKLSLSGLESRTFLTITY